MLNAVARQIFGTRNDRVLKGLRRIVTTINDLESSLTDLTEDQLRAKTHEFKGRIVEGETLDDLLPEAFSVVREAAKRTLGERHYDVQLMSGLVLHDGNITGGDCSPSR